MQPAQRIASLADPGSVHTPPAFAGPRASPHLARWGIARRDDDGITVAAARVHGREVLFAAQDATFLRGAVGAQHAAALEALFVAARTSRPAAVVLLLASGGVRLHEANPAELALARAIRVLLDLRAAGVPVLALAVGDVFGGASVLACAADRLALLPRARLGLSGPKVIATARGASELDVEDAGALASLYGAAARASAGHCDMVVDDAEVLRAWVAAGSAAVPAFADAVRARHAQLARAVPPPPPTVVPTAWRDLLEAVAPGLWRARDADAWVLGAAGAQPVGAGLVHGWDEALLAHVVPRAAIGATLWLVEDSTGHEVSVAAERACLSRHLAHHAAMLALVRHAGVRLRGVLIGQGHSAAFFTHALQADELVAVADARVMAMDPQAVARVTGLSAAALTAAIESDPLVGHAIACFARWGGVQAILPAIGPDLLLGAEAR